jgi:hypothetical protein
MEIGWIDTPEEWRDVIVMCFAVAGTILFLLGWFFTIAIGMLTYSTIRRARNLMTDKVAPTLDSVKETSESVRGTVGFIGDNAVTPVVKVYGAAAGARRFVSVVARFTRGRGDE